MFQTHCRWAIFSLTKRNKRIREGKKREKAMNSIDREQKFQIFLSKRLLDDKRRQMQKFSVLFFFGYKTRKSEGKNDDKRGK